MNESGLYERLHESEKRRKVAAILADCFIVAGKGDIASGLPSEGLTVPEVVSMFEFVMSALSGDFEMVWELAVAADDKMLLTRLGVVLDKI